MLPIVMSGDWKAVDKAIDQFQQTALRLRYSRVPVVAAVQGYAFGGESYILASKDTHVITIELAEPPVEPAG